MADNKGRRRNSGSDDFDWEAYDAQSGSRSSRSTSRSSSDIARRRETDSYASHPRRTRKKSGKKQLTEKQLSHDLEASEQTFVRIDFKVGGIGSGSCGPELLEKYRLNDKHIEFEFSMRPMMLDNADLIDLM